jgi:hypothetical protein
VRTAVGEVVMIVAGVLIALAASDTQQRFAERGREIDVLEELSSALATDILLLDRQVERYENIEVRVGVLLEVLGSGAPYADSVDAYFRTLYGIDRPRLNTAGYQSLKSQGLDLISDGRAPGRKAGPLSAKGFEAELGEYSNEASV